MAFKRVATLDIKTVYAADQNGKFMWREFVKQANENPSQDRTDFLPKEAYKYDTDHFLFLTARAISGMEKHGHNGNYDAFPWEEIKKALPTYPGCGFYIEHKEDSCDDAKGIILDVFPNEEEQYAVCLCAIDKEAYPEFVQQILDGTYNQVSMSLLANECECSLCGNVAHSFDELCQHMNPNMPITFMKGKKDDQGNDIYEINRDLCFTGLSAVAVPADKDAFIFDIKASKKKENKLQQELFKYQNTKKAAKMKEFRTACEEEFKALDTVALLNKLQNCATTITNQVVDQNAGAEVINGPLQGILKELMELQIGLTILDLNKLVTPEVEPAPTAVGEPIAETKPAEEIVEEEKADGGHILTNDELEEVNFDKEIDSYDNWSYTPFSSTASSNKEAIINALNKSGIAGSISSHGNISNNNYKVYEDNDGNLIVTVYTRGKNIAENIISLVEPFGYKAIKEDNDILETTVTFEKEPFSNTATKKQAGVYFLKNNKELQDFLNLHGEEINDIKIKNDGKGYRVYFENEYGKFHDDIYVTKTFSSLDEIINKTYK